MWQVIRTAVLINVLNPNPTIFLQIPASSTPSRSEAEVRQFLSEHWAADSEINCIWILRGTSAVKNGCLAAPDYDCLAASRFARYSRSPSSTGLSASYLDSAAEFSLDLAFTNLAATFTAPLAAK